MAIISGNSSFFFPGKTLNYAVSVHDREDGSLANKRILPSQVSVSANYLSEGFNLTEIAQKQLSTDVSTQFSGAISLINKIINGGSGVWGHTLMPSHPTMTEGDARTITRYILSLAYPPRSAKTLPVQGAYTTSVPEGENAEGSFIIRAAYTDRGTKGTAPQSAEKILVLRSPLLPVAEADQVKDVIFNADRSIATIDKTGAFLKFSKVDLTYVRQIELVIAGRTPVSSQVKIDIRAGSPEGKLLGTFSVEANAQAAMKAVLREPAGITDLYFVFTNAPLRIRQIRLSNLE